MTTSQVLKKRETKYVLKHPDLIEPQVKKSAKVKKNRKSMYQRIALWQFYKDLGGESPSKQTISELADQLDLKVPQVYKWFWDTNKKIDSEHKPTIDEYNQCVGQRDQSNSSSHEMTPMAQRLSMLQDSQKDEFEILANEIGIDVEKLAQKIIDMESPTQTRQVVKRIRKVCQNDSAFKPVILKPIFDFTGLLEKKPVQTSEFQKPFFTSPNLAAHQPYQRPSIKDMGPLFDQIETPQKGQQPVRTYSNVNRTSSIILQNFTRQTPQSPFSRQSSFAISEHQQPKSPSLWLQQNLQNQQSSVPRLQLKQKSSTCNFQQLALDHHVSDFSTENNAVEKINKMVLNAVRHRLQATDQKHLELSPQMTSSPKPPLSHSITHSDDKIIEKVLSGGSRCSQEAMAAEQ